MTVLTPPIKSPDGVLLVKHTDNFTHYINASLKLRICGKRLCSRSSVTVFFFPLLYLKNSRVYLPRVFRSKQIHARNVAVSKLHVVRNTEGVNLVMTSVTSISITVLKLFLPDIPSCVV